MTTGLPSAPLSESRRPNRLMRGHTIARLGLSWAFLFICMFLNDYIAVAGRPYLIWRKAGDQGRYALDRHGQAGGRKTRARLDFPQIFLLNAPLLGGPAGHAVAAPNAPPVRSSVHPPRGTGFVRVP